MTDFFQDGPILQNPYESDPLLRLILEQSVSSAHFKVIDEDLKKFSRRVLNEIEDLGWQAENERPQHVPYDPFGRRIDEIKVSSAWQRLNDISAEEGLVALGFERTLGETSRIYQFAKLYLFHPSSAFFSCPLAMTDGAARVLEVYGSSEKHKEAFKNLVSRNPKTFWTSGQWMTEKTGGSDVSQTLTVARREKDCFLLSGTKWFSSATTSQMALALARIEGAEEGSRGLSLFLVEMRDKNGKLNGISVNRLKDKLGTKALPTAELSLVDAKAYLVGEEGKGVKTVATMLNITRLYNSICSVGQSQRALALLQDYSRKRNVFGKKLVDQAAFASTFSAELAEHSAHLALTFFVVGLLGKEECKTASSEEADLLRLMTPIVKLSTAKTAIRVTSEVLEGFGGLGYIEDSRIPVLFRDAQVFPIWEGASNVLSLDVLRVLSKGEALKSCFNNMNSRLVKTKKQLGAEGLHFVEELEQSLKILSSYALNFKDLKPEVLESLARGFAVSLGRVFSQTLLLELWSKANGSKDKSYLKAIIEEFMASGLLRLRDPSESRLRSSQKLTQ